MSERRRALEERAEKVVRKVVNDPRFRAVARRKGFSDRWLDKLGDDAAREARLRAPLWAVEARSRAGVRTPPRPEPAQTALRARRRLRRPLRAQAGAARAGAPCRGQATGAAARPDCFYLGRLSGTKGTVWQYTAIDVASGVAWAELHLSPRNPRAEHCRPLVERVAGELAAAGWRLEAVITDG